MSDDEMNKLKKEMIDFLDSDQWPRGDYVVIIGFIDEYFEDSLSKRALCHTTK